jgi:multidrug transporter EmrE-like cation transporter
VLQALIGSLCFSEATSRAWWFGMAFILAGVVTIRNALPEEDERRPSDQQHNH